VWRHDADLQHDDPQLRRLRLGRRLRRVHPRLSGFGRLRAVLGDQQHPVHRRNAGLLHDDGDVRAVHLECTVRRNGAGLQLGHPPLPRLCQRR
jgi:hypothetical protein